MKIDSQISFDFTGSQLRDAGLSLAVENAESKNNGWKERTWILFKEFLRDQREPFLMESFRAYLAMIDDYEFPHTNRAYGAIALKAAREGLIKKIGHKNVSTATAHACFAALWEKI